MTEAQHLVFIAIDTYWSAYGYGPSIDDLMRMTGSKSRSNILRICNILVREKYCKRTPNTPRSIRPVYINHRKLP